MYEGSTYHAVYMHTPRMWNWTKTHGGPYYLEVGKNITVQYMNTENISIPIITPILIAANGTNGTNVTTVNETTYTYVL
jgi:hypothetical protein